MSNITRIYSGNQLHIIHKWKRKNEFQKKASNMKKKQLNFVINNSKNLSDTAVYFMKIKYI